MNWDTFKRQNLTSISAPEAAALDDLAVLFDILINRRVEMKISQQELAEMTGLKQSAIARFENLKVIPRVDTVVKIARALDCSLTFVENN